MRLPHEALPKILHALQQPVTPSKAEQNARVIDLRGITATDPAEVVQTAKPCLCSKAGMCKATSIRQAGTSTSRLHTSSARSWSGKWQTWVVFLAALLSLSTVALGFANQDTGDLPRARQR